MDKSSQGNFANPPSAWLLHQWVIAGIVSASTRFIPIPFVDQLIQTQCRRFAVSTTLSTHESNIELSELQPYYGSGEGCLTGCLNGVFRVPLKLLIFPFRKLLSAVTSIRGVPLEIMRMVLLGRTLDRCLRSGALVNKHNSAEITVAQTATHMRQAFDHAFNRMDIKVIQAAIKDALSGVTALQATAAASLKRAVHRDSQALQEVQSDATVEAEADRVQAALDQPDVLALFSEFDRRFDQFLTESKSAATSPSRLER